MASEPEVKGLPPAGTAAIDRQYTRISIPPVVTIIGVIALLYLGRDVLLPLSIALLLTFTLAPIVSFLRRRRAPRAVAVIATVAIAFSVIAFVGFLLASQVTMLAQNVPAYQANIIEKIHTLKHAGGEGGVIDRITSAIERVGAELRATTPLETAAADSTEVREPIPVEVVTSQGPLEILENIVVPLVSPFATAGLVIVVVIFMLFERETLRDRFIRLASAGDIHRTTEALQDAGRRVGQYLLMQLIINTTYAVPITLGLWLIGVPNALLWGILTLMLRFVPYIGPAIGMFLPLLVTFAALPGWTPILLVAGLFIVMELISNNVMEPWLYGSRTGISSLAVIVSAIFWGWLWGPLGLLLSTPLTVCLVVLGRHVPQFEFLDVLLGNDPVLEPHARVYQRLLAGDPDEAFDYAEGFLEDAYLVDFYEKVGIPALLLGEQDRQRGVMSEERRALFSASAQTFVADMEEIAGEEEVEEDVAEHRSDEDGKPAIELPDGDGKALLCVGGRGSLDDVAAMMLAQVMEVQGAKVSRVSHDQLGSGRVSNLPLEGKDTIVIAFLNATSTTQARYAVRRFKRLRAGLRVGLFMPAGVTSGDGRAEVTADMLNADFIAESIEAAVIAGFAETKASRLRTTAKRRAPRARSKAAEHVAAA